MATLMEKLNQKNEQPKEQFEGYWKDNPNPYLAKFDAKSVDANLDEATKKRAISAGYDAARNLNSILKEVIDAIPENMRKEADPTELDKAKDLYPSRAKVTVEPAKDKDGKALLKKSGEPVLSVKAEIAKGESFLTLAMNEAGTEIRGMAARTLVEQDGKKTAVRADMKDLDNANLDKKIIKLAKAIEEKGLIKEKPAFEKTASDAPKKPSAKATLFKLSEALKEAYGAVKGNDGKWDYTNCVANVNYNKEETGENGHPASVNVFCKQGEVNAASITFGIRNGDFNARVQEMAKGEDGKYQTLGEGVFINEPSDINDLSVPDVVKQSVCETLGFDSEMYKAAKALNERYAGETMPNEKGEQIPVVRAFYHNANDTVFVKDKGAADGKCIEIDADGGVTEVTVTEKDGKNSYNRQEISDISGLSDVYKAAVQTVKDAVQAKEEKGVEFPYER